MMAVRTSAPRRPLSAIRRNLLMLGCAAGALSFVLADRAHAQAFEGTPGTQAGSVTRWRPAYPAGASVSTIEKPHGDHAPVTPATKAAATNALSTP